MENIFQHPIIYAPYIIIYLDGVFNHPKLLSDDNKQSQRMQTMFSHLCAALNFHTYSCHYNWHFKMTIELLT
jgi:hypothetical protein